MARYFFNIVNDSTALDREGVDLPDRRAAESQARTLAQAFASRGTRPREVLVTDEHGKEICRAPIGPARA